MYKILHLSGRSIPLKWLLTNGTMWNGDRHFFATKKEAIDYAKDKGLEIAK